MFWILSASLSVIITTYLTLRLTGGLNWPLSLRMLIGACLLGMFMLPYFSQKIIPLFDNQQIRYGISILAYLPMVILMLLFCLSILRDIIWMPLSLFLDNRFSAVNPALLRLSNLVFIGIALAMGSISVFQGLKSPAVKEITLSSPKIQTPMRIVLLSDLHLNSLTPPKQIETMVQKTNALRPDVILITGDIVDAGLEELNTYIPLLRRLKAPKGIYATLGNHEFYVGQKRSLEFFHAAGMQHLFNTGVRLSPDVYLGGVPDHQAIKRLRLHHITADAEQALAEATKTDYKILMSHQPAFIDTLQPNMLDLQVSGHTHGGHIFPLHFVIRLVNHYLSGLYHTPHGSLYVSSGTFQWGPIMRLGSEKEITLIRLEPETP